MLCCEKNTTRDSISLRVCYNNEGVDVVGWVGLDIFLLQCLWKRDNYRLLKITRLFNVYEFIILTRFFFRVYKVYIYKFQDK